MKKLFTDFTEQNYFCSKHAPAKKKFTPYVLSEANGPSFIFLMILFSLPPLRPSIWDPEMGGPLYGAVLDGPALVELMLA